MTGYWFVDELPGWQPPEDLLSFLEKGEPPLVVSLGAMSRDQAAARETAELFVSAIQKTGLRVVIIGWDAALKGMSLPVHIFPSGSVPFGWLLPLSAGIVHHGGFGTTAEGFRAGIPELVIPHIVDQFNWAQKVVELGVGPKPIPAGKLDQARLSAAMKDLQENDRYRTAALSLGEQIRSECGIDQAVRIIQEVF
jgi:UDP:flavonoid glycosyltransferase YjiC (YdhE family)